MSSDSVSVLERIIWLIHSILRMFVAVVVAYAISLMFGLELNEWMTWHYALMSSGIVLVMFEGILTLSPYNHFTQGIRKNLLNGVHGCLMATGFAMMTAGIACAYHDHSDGHFTSTHGIMGLTSWILCVTAGLGGLLAYYSFSLKEYVRPIYIRFCHTFIGLSAFLLSIATAVTGFHNFIDYKPTPVPIMMTLLIIIGVGIFLRSGRTVVERLRTALTN